MKATQVEAQIQGSMLMGTMQQGNQANKATSKISTQNRSYSRSNAKEAAEHVMLVDLARNDLGRVAVPGTIQVHPYRTIEKYSHVMHLVSGVIGDIESTFLLNHSLSPPA
jgi:anthranilate synthase component 1